MAIYSNVRLAGIVGYKQLYPNVELYPLEKLLSGLPRIWAVRLVSNIQSKLVGKPFYNPNFRDTETSQIDVPRFFFGPNNLNQLNDVINRYETYLTLEAKRQQQPMTCATGNETPLLLLKHIMAMPESDRNIDIDILERKLFLAFMIANELTFNREQGELPYKQDDDLELYISSLLISRYAYNDYVSEKSELDDLVRNQISRTALFFNFVTNHPMLKELLNDFLVKYELISWNDYIKTYLSIQAIARSKMGVIDFMQLKDEDNLLSEKIVDEDSIDINKPIPLSCNIDYETFRKKPFIKIAPHEYAVIDITFIINRMYDGLYFIFNEFWKNKHPEDPNKFKQIISTDFSEITIIDNCLREISNYHNWFSLTDPECKIIVPERILSSSPDFYIRDGKNVFLFECKDVRIPKEIKAEGSTKQLLDEIDKDFVGYQNEKGRWRYKGVGQLVRNAKRIQDGLFAWDKAVKMDSRIFLVLVLNDYRQVSFGWKNYLNKKMYEECVRQNVDYSRVCPLILLDIGTLVLYKQNFMKHGFLKYFTNYYKKTHFDCNAINNRDKMIDLFNQTLSFSGYMNMEKLCGGEELRQNLISAITKQR